MIIVRYRTKTGDQGRHQFDSIITDPDKHEMGRGAIVFTKGTVERLILMTASIEWIEIYNDEVS